MVGISFLRTFVSLFALAAFASDALAYVPPSYFMADRLAKRRSGLESAVVQFEIFKPAADKDKAPATFLWKGSLVYFSGKAGGKLSPGTWPVLETILDPEGNRVLAAWKSFGLPVNREEELVIRRGRASKEGDDDGAFYRRENSLSIRRYENKIAWQLSDADQKKRLLIEKDSFDPVAMIGPCPAELTSTFLGAAREAQECALEFRYEGGGGNALQTPATVWLKINGHEFAYMKINRIQMNAPEKVLREAMKTNQSETLADADEAVRAFYRTFLH